MNVEIQKVDKGLYQSLCHDLSVSKTNTFETALKNAGFIQADERLEKYVDVQPWQRGGAESYVAVAEISTNQQVFKVHAKALVSSSKRPQEQLADWLQKRDALVSIAVRVPKLFSSFRGTLYEQYIELPFLETDLSDHELLLELADIVRKLDSAKIFAPDILRDLRKEHGEVYLVDFGSDLIFGASSQYLTSESLLKKFSDQLGKGFSKMIQESKPHRKR